MRIFKTAALLAVGLVLSAMVVFPANAAGEEAAVNAYPLLSMGDNAVEANVSIWDIRNIWGSRKTANPITDDVWLIPSGEPFGIKFYTEGVLVIALSEVETADGEKNPAYYAGIRERDIILSIDGTEITSNEQMSKIVEDSGGKELSVRYKRNNKIHTVSIKPVLSTDSIYKLGVWIRDSTAGIGTITFINPETGEFGGLGHGICDVDTGCLMPLGTASVYSANIVGITRGQKGVPGELKGQFASNTAIGEIHMNTGQGVFGTLEGDFDGYTAYKAAAPSEVVTGDAKIICTTDRGEPKEYSVYIEKLYKNSGLEKNFLIRVTDEELLSETGGIVQGMSGSPIIQNGKLIGAVTHVLVNDPTRGFGIHISNMLTVSGYQQQRNAA